MTNRSLATLLLGLSVTAAMAPARAEMIDDPQLTQFSTASAPGPKGSTVNSFGFRAAAGRTIHDDPHADFNYSYTPSKSLLSFLRFERVLQPIGGGALVEFPIYIFLAKKGTVLTDASISARKDKSFRYEYNQVQKATVGRDVWLAMGVRKGYLNQQPPRPYTTFKWIHLRFNTAGVPEVIDSITAYDEPGLVVGEKTPCKAQACLEAAAP